MVSGKKKHEALVIRLRNVGGSLTVAKGTSGVSKPKNKVKRPRPIQISIDTVSFAGAADIWYARIPNQGPGGHPSYIRTGQERARHHFTPPVVRPALGSPHWENNNAHPVSWPAAYVRDGAPGGPHARGLQASFSATGRFTGQREIRAVGPHGIITDVVMVNFNLGSALAVNFTFQVLPNTVRCLSNINLTWQSRPVGAGHFTAIGQSCHTLYILDATPRVALGVGEHHYFEVIDWSCRWGDNQAGAANVLAQILARFQPVAPSHASGLIYWRNHNVGVPPAQDVATAIQYQDHGIHERKASSCKVFDYLFLNCLSIHGIQAAEIELQPAQYAMPLAPLPPPPYPPPTGFLALTPGGGGAYTYYFNPTSWAASTVNAHGNPGAPDGWSNHWVAAIHTGVGVTGWQLYDPSYGLGPYDLAGAPVLWGALAIPAAYDAAGVQHFACWAWSDDGINTVVRVDNLPSGNPNPPHLIGFVLTIN